MALLCAGVLFFNLGSYGLFDADEGRYAEIPREMLERGDWITPTLNYVKFFDKPPLLYWEIMVCFQVLGHNEWAARLPVALHALLGIAASYFLAKRMWGQKAAFIAAMICATCVIWPLLGRVIVTDMPLSSLIVTALAFWWFGHTEKSSRRQLYYLGFWASLGFAILAKGPVAVVLAFGAIFPYLLWCKQRGALNLRFWAGSLLMFAIATPWFILVAQRNPEFNHYFWYIQHIGRFLGKGDPNDHWESPTYYLQFLPLILFPWIAFFPAALFKVGHTFSQARLNPNADKARAMIFLVCGFVFVLLFFSISKSKIITYIAAVVPLFAVALAGYLQSILNSEKPCRPLKNGALFLSILSLVLAIAGFAAAPKALAKLEVAPIWAYGASALLLVWSAALLASFKRARSHEILTTTGFGFGIILTFAIALVSQVAPDMTTKPILEKLRPHLTLDTQIASVGFIQSLSFYSGRRVKVDGLLHDERYGYGIPDELLYGWQHLNPKERSEWFYGDINGLKKLMRQDKPVFCVYRNQRLKGTEGAKWLNLDDGARILLKSERYTVVGNREASANWQKTN